MKQKPTDAVACNALYLLFGDFYECIKKSKFEDKIDENDVTNYGYCLKQYYKATSKEDLIRKLRGSKCQKLLSDVLLYSYKEDPYFNPKLNTLKQFFIKIYRNRKMLAKIGSGEHELVFPFVKLFKYKKKVLLIRC